MDIYDQALQDLLVAYNSMAKAQGKADRENNDQAYSWTEVALTELHQLIEYCRPRVHATMTARRG